jgi:hypothetical protein
MYPIRLILSLDVGKKSPSEVMRLLEPILAKIPGVEQFSLSEMAPTLDRDLSRAMRRPVYR